MLFYGNSKTTRELILGSDATRGGGAEKASVSLPPIAEYYEKYSQNVFYLNLTSFILNWLRKS